MAQTHDGSSLLHEIRSQIADRPPEFGTAPFARIDVGEESVLAYARGRFSVVANFSPEPRTVAVASVGQIAGPASTDGVTVALPPYGWAWLTTRTEGSREIA